MIFRYHALEWEYRKCGVPRSLGGPWNVPWLTIWKKKQARLPRPPLQGSYHANTKCKMFKSPRQPYTCNYIVLPQPSERTQPAVSLLHPAARKKPRFPSRPTGFALKKARGNVDQVVEPEKKKLQLRHVQVPQQKPNTQMWRTIPNQKLQDILSNCSTSE